MGSRTWADRAWSGLIVLVFCVGVAAMPLAIAQDPVPSSKAGPQDFALSRAMAFEKTYALGQKIIVSYDGQIPKGGRLSILWDPDASLDIEQSANRIFIWTTTPGEKSCDATVIPLRTLTVEGQTFDVLAGPPVRYKVRFKVEGWVGPNPPKPGPVVPGPGPKKSLKEAQRFVIVMDTGSDTQAENESLLRLRSDPTWKDKVLILDRSQAPPRFLPQGGESDFPFFNAEDSTGAIYRTGHIDELMKGLSE